jgi:hypothetical protein
MIKVWTETDNVCLRLCMYSCRPAVTPEQVLSFAPLPKPVPLQVRTVDQHSSGSNSTK